MEKVLRNVIIFASIILVVAAVSVIMAVSGSKSITPATASVIDDSNTVTGEVQDVKLSVSGAKYILTPSVLKKDVPVRMEADLSTLKGCSRDVVISAFDVRKYLKEGDNIITFTPTKTGTINIACSMNMYRGTFTVE
jgi:plastocyanin domain-containing protein